MPLINLTHYLEAAGVWTDPAKYDANSGFSLADTLSADRLMLRWPGDFLKLHGPLSVRVTVQAENMTFPSTFSRYFEAGNGLDGGAAGAPSVLDVNARATSASGYAQYLHASTIYSYTLDIPAGQFWPFALAELVNAPLVAGRIRLDQLGNNLGYRILIEPAVAAAKLAPVTSGADLPCDYAVADRPDTASFFPAACEPCGGGTVGLPPGGTLPFVTPPADGGCVRTRFFNGMFITSEDLETEQRYHRLKSRLHNRAAGAGVVWGLGVGKQGGQVWVLPGYGIDCCGNDLTVTTPYKIDIANLLADPAALPALRRRGQRRMHLLLEYVECPSNPRPVHGDPCAAESSRCEMSRIRETVRLRLVPPRDYDAKRSGEPIQKFLDEVSAMLPKQDATGPEPYVPFQFRVTANPGTAEAESQTFRPQPNSDQQTIVAKFGHLSKTVLVEVLLDPLWTFMSGEIVSSAASTQVQIQPPHIALSPGLIFSPASLQIRFDKLEAVPSLSVSLGEWAAQNLFAAEDEPVFTGSVNLTIDRPNNTINRFELQTKTASSTVDLDSPPCGGEPCAAGEGDADPTPVLPWLHVDPANPAIGGDPKALVLAALGAWLMQMRVRERAGLEGEVKSLRRVLAETLYRLAWEWLYGVSSTDDLDKLGGAVKRLLQAWCDELLWTGPQCQGDPHGVVIGCAHVAGGTIQRIDPFGGRRHVVHYPLLAHWGAQFGLAPLDVTASRFFEALCCVASLPAVGSGGDVWNQGILPLGGAYLALLGQNQTAAAQLKSQGLANIREERVVALPEMVSAVVQALSSAAPAQAASGYTVLKLAGSGASLALALPYAG